MKNEAHRLNMKIDLLSLFGLNVHKCTHLGSYTRALLVSQDRRHLFVTPLMKPQDEFPSVKLLDLFTNNTGIYLAQREQKDLERRKEDQDPAAFVCRRVEQLYQLAVSKCA
jgi:hypothetical protein